MSSSHNNITRQSRFTGNHHGDPVLPGDLTVTVARSLEKVEEIREIWNNFDPFPFANIDYFISHINLRREIVRPHVIILSRDGKPETLCVGKIEDIRLKYKISYKVIFKPSVRSLTVVTGGIAGNISSDNCEKLIAELMKPLQEQEADILSFSEIKTSSHLYQHFRRATGFLFRDHFPDVDVWFRMTLPHSIDEFYKARSRGKRTRLKSLLKRMEKKYPGSVNIEYFQTSDRIEEFCRDAEQISKKTYQYEYEGGFVGNTDMHHLLHLSAENKSLVAYILYVRDAPVAYWLGIVHQGTSYGIQGGTGYDPAYKKHEVGTLLLLKVIEDLTINPDVNFIDFGRGSSFYKQRMCDSTWEAADFSIFQPSLRGVQLNAMRSLTGVIHFLGNIILVRFRLRDKWMRYRRGRFAQIQNRSSGSH